MENTKTGHTNNNEQETEDLLKKSSKLLEKSQETNDKLFEIKKQIDQLLNTNKQNKPPKGTE